MGEMITAGVLGVGVVAAGGAAAAGAAGAFFYKRKQKRKKKKMAKKRKESTVFGQHLEDLAALSEDGLPVVVELCVEWLETFGLDTPDLFTSNRSPIRAGELAKEFDKGKTPSFDREDPRDISSLLLRYLADLPEPLCTAVLFDDFVQLEVNSSNIEDWIEGMRNLLLQLPDTNFRTMRKLAVFLWTVAKNWEQNPDIGIPLSDTAESLSKTFGRLVFDSWDSECSDSTNPDGTNPRQSLMFKLITNNSRVFAGVATPVLSRFDKRANTRETSEVMPKMYEDTSSTQAGSISLSKKD